MAIDNLLRSPKGGAEKSADPPTRIGAHTLKAPSIENGGKESATGERAQMGASDLQASPLSEGDRRLWLIYTKRQAEVPLAASWRMILSRVRSATLVRGWPFSRSSSFRRLACAVATPPNSCRHRTALSPVTWRAPIGRGTQFEPPPPLGWEDQAVFYQDLAVNS